MGLPSSGPIDFAAIRTELSLGGTLDLNDSRVRGLAGKPSGAISFSDLLGKSNIVSFNTPTSIPSLLFAADQVTHILTYPLFLKTKSITASFNCVGIYKSGKALNDTPLSDRSLQGVTLHVKNSLGVSVAASPTSVSVVNHSVEYTSPSPSGEDLHIEISYKSDDYLKGVRRNDDIEYEAFLSGYYTNGTLSLTGTYIP